MPSIRHQHPRGKPFKRHRTGRFSPDPAAYPGGLLVNKDQDLLDACNGNLQEARSIITRRIQDVLRGIVGVYQGTPPASPHAHHSFLEPKLGTGSTDYRQIGAYMVVCVPHDYSKCGLVRYITSPIEERKIFNHEELTPLLLMREELKVYHKATTKVPRTVPITQSPYYRGAVRRFYMGPPELERWSLPSSTSMDTPPLAIRNVGEGSSQQRPAIGRTEKSGRSSSPITVEEDGDSDKARMDGRKHKKAKPKKKAMVIIDITDSEDDTRMTKTRRVPLLLIFCTEDSAEYKSLFLFGDEGAEFSLRTLYADLNEKGVRLYKPWEIYSPDGQWSLWDVEDVIARHAFDGDNLQTFFFRVVGTKTDEITPEYRHLSSLAGRFKGKGRA